MSDDEAPDYARVWPATVVSADDLVGREPVLRDVLANVQSGRSVLLAAPRRLGKTSIAQEALRRLERAGAVTASLDFMRLTSRRSLADQLTEQLLTHSHSLRDRVLRRAGRAVSQRVRQVKPHWGVASLEFGMEFQTEDEDILLDKALELPAKIAERDSCNVVILMDEFQEAGSNLGREIYGILRASFQQQPDVQQLFLGSQESMLRALFTRPNAPLLRHAVEVPLPGIPHDDWRAYLARKFTEAGQHLRAVLIPQILAATGGHPADTMEVCRQLSIMDASGELDGEVDDSVVPVAVELAEVALGPVFEQVWVALGAIGYSRTVAARLAHGQPPYGAAKTHARRGRVPRRTEIPSQTLSRALKALVDKGLVAKVGRRYAFREPMFERYVRRLTGDT